MTPLLGLEYRQPALLEARGTLALTLNGIDGYAGQGDALAHCRSEPGAEGVAFVEANAVGNVGTGIVVATVSILSSDSRPEVLISIVPADKAESSTPTWQGPADVVEPTDGDRSGRVAFTGAALIADETGLPPKGWPAELSGTVIWSCAEWQPLGADGQP